MASSATRQPVIYVPHGGGPWPFVELRGFISPRDVDVLRNYFVQLPAQLPQPPKALLVVSAHWERPAPTVMTSPQPPIYYDYGGFPPEAYEIQWPAPGEPVLAERVVKLLADAGIEAKSDPRRGFDHGTFIPFKLSWPNADVPTIQLSLKQGLDPQEHLAIGRALAPLRDEGVLILGSGMSFHDLRSFGSSAAMQVSSAFGGWLNETVTAKHDTRDARLVEWESAPLAREAHPREEHLLPLMVVAGAAGSDPGRIGFDESFMGARISAYHFG
jgi:aromatic ring-opening dioxygenase catalytic subunit (LigB family)